MPPLPIRIQIGAPRRQFHGLDSDRLQDPIECSAEFCISIVQQIPAAAQKADLGKAHVPRHLLHPALVRRRRHAGNPHLPGCHSHQRQHLVSHQSTRRPYFSSEKVYRGQDFHVRADELPPAHRSATFGRGCDGVSFQKIGYRLVADFVAEIIQRARNPAISPTGILSCQSQNQFFDLIPCSRPSQATDSLSRQTSWRSIAGATRESFPDERSAPLLPALSGPVVWLRKLS